MNIIIPMAGQGKRLRPHTLTQPKPLISIAGKPMVQRIVEDITATCKEPVGEVAFIINPAFGKAVEEHLLQVASAVGAQGRIYYQHEAKGTAHAILSARESLSGEVFIAFADTLFEANFSIDTSKEAIVWTQKIDDPSAFGVVKLGEGNRIEAFVEKPVEWVSDLAIIGVYYFRDGELLSRELQRLLDENIMSKGEYQLTDAMDHMLRNGVRFYTDQVAQWLDCGNAAATVQSTAAILALKEKSELMIDSSAEIQNSIIIQPSYVGPGVKVKNSVVGPFASVEAGSNIEDSRIAHSIVGKESAVKNAVLSGAMLGSHVNYTDTPKAPSLGDFSTQ